MAFPYTNEQIKVGVRSVLALWQALADDDDGRLRELLPEPALAYLGVGPGLAARLREWLDVTVADCRTIGYKVPLEILADDRLRVACVREVTVTREYEAGEPLIAWRVELELVDGRWFVDPIRAHDTGEIGTYDWT